MAYSKQEIKTEWINQTNKRTLLTTNEKTSKTFNLSDGKRLGNVIRLRKERD